MARSVSTSARRRLPRSRTGLPAPEPSSGTDRWACSRSGRSPRVPVVWRRRSRRSTDSPSLAAATRPRQSARSASTRTRSDTSPRAAARRSNTSKVRRCPVSPLWKREVKATDAGRRPLKPGERRPLMAGNWKMNLNHLEAIALTQKLAFSFTAEQLTDVEVVVLPPFTDIRSVQTLVDGDKLLIGYGAQDLSVHA